MNEAIYGVEIGARANAVHTDTIALTEHLFAAAVAAQASDIHLQQQEADVEVRLRIGGGLVPFMSLTKQQAAQVFSRLKVLMRLDITLIGQPQDGSFRLKIGEKVVDIRGSFFPSLQGEKAVIRLLGAQESLIQLHTLPFSSSIIASLYGVARRDNGLFLVTGPTGAGKTTTLYALLQAVDRVSRNVVTLENPVEYRISGVTQTQIDAFHPLTFAQAVRSLLRQDPDVALIGELRDSDSVHSAIEAALTGHLVMSSLHTGRASGVPVRLREMGVEPYLIAHALRGVLAQRLLVALCEQCRIMVPLSSKEREWAESRGFFLAATGFSAGCASCNYTGRGELRVIAELWLCKDGGLGGLLQNGVSTQADFEAIAKKDGMVPLISAGIELARAGIISLSVLMNADL